MRSGRVGRVARVLWVLVPVALVSILVIALLTPDGRAPQRATPLPPVERPVVQTAEAAPVPTVDEAEVRRQRVEELLEVRSAAVRDRDRESWLNTVADDVPEFAERQAQVFDNLAAVPLERWTYEYAGEGEPLPADRQAELGQSAWVARVVLSYRLADADGADVRSEHYLTVVERGERWLAADDSDGDSASDLWDLGPVNVVHGDRSLVLGTGATDVLERYAAEADESALQVDRVWGQAWPRTVVLNVPDSQEEMAALLLRDDATGLDQVAAVTTGELSTDLLDATSDRVIVNPSAFEQLGDVGRNVVLTHEIAHVAARAQVRGEVPIWLSEGLADYVAYLPTGVARELIAVEVLDQVRAGQGPRELPTPEDFDPEVSTIAPAYSASWLAVDLIAQEHGEDVLLRFYRAAAGAGTTNGAFHNVLGTDPVTFEQRWREHLDQLAS